jgi:LCP family protein required for cell wall assembly
VATVPVLPPNVKAWPDKERMTILLMGLDKRPGEVGRGFRADTLILLSLDPETRKIGMLSIPRDVYLPIPNQPDMQPINSVYVLGELRRPGDGPRLTAETLSYNFGMPIDHFVVVSFETVIKLVDAIGGVDIDVAQAIEIWSTRI